MSNFTLPPQKTLAYRIINNYSKAIKKELFHVGERLTPRVGWVYRSTDNLLIGIFASTTGNDNITVVEFDTDKIDLHYQLHGNYNKLHLKVILKEFPDLKIKQ